MKILIIGGTGVLSYDFTKLIIENNHEIYLLNRGKTSLDFVSKCKLIYADIRNENIDSLRTKICSDKYDVVVDFLSYDSRQVEKIINVISGCYKKYVFISTAMVCSGNSEKGLIDESSITEKGRWEYADKKIEAENYVKENVDNYYIIRPYITYGKTRIPYPMSPDKYYYTLIKRIKDEMPIPLLNGGKTLCTLTNTKDFANILYGLISLDKNNREIYNIVSDDVVSWKEIYDCICDILGVRHNMFSMTEDEVKRFLPEYYDSLKCGKGIDFVVSGKKAYDALESYECKVSMRQGIRESVQFYLDNIEYQGIDFRWDGRIDYAYRKINHKVCKFYPTKGNKDKSTNIWAYYFMQNSLLRKIYKILKKSAYE